MKRLLLVLTALITALAAVSCALPGEDPDEDLLAWQENYDLGRKYLNEENYQKAIEAFQDAIYYDSENPKAYLAICETCIKAGDYETAISILEMGYQETQDEQFLTEIDKTKKLMEEKNSEENKMKEEQQKIMDAQALQALDNPLGDVPISDFSISMTGIEGMLGESDDPGPFAEIEWSVENGVLTIKGDGKMPHYNYKTVPWKDVKDDVTSIVVENGITGIGDFAFYLFNNLTSVSLPDGLERIGRFSFAYNPLLTNVDLPSSVTTICDFAFSKCPCITSVTLSKNIKDVRHCAFADCDGITTVNLEQGLTFVGDGAFAGCDSLATVALPSSIEVIEKGAFTACKSLKPLTFGNSLTTIGDNAFSDCPLIDKAVIPASVTNLSPNAYEWCENLTSYTIEDGNPNYSSDENGILYNKDKTVLLSCPESANIKDLVIPSTVTRIETSAFHACENIVSVVMPDSVTELGVSTFTYCNALTSIKFSNSLKVIPSGTLARTIALNEVVIPDGVAKIETKAILDSGVTVVTIPESVTSMEDGAIMFANYPSHQVTIRGKKGSAAEKYCEIDTKTFKFVEY